MLALNKTTLKAMLSALAFSIASVAGGQGLPLEEFGVITSVDPSRSIITVDGRKLKLTTATEISAQDPSLRYSGMARSWVGYEVSMETTGPENTTPIVTKLHFFTKRP